MGARGCSGGLPLSRRVGLDRPMFQEHLLGEFVARLGQEEVQLGPGLRQGGAAGVGPHQVVGAVGVVLEEGK